jgi:hypothetical protein
MKSFPKLLRPALVALALIASCISLHAQDDPFTDDSTRIDDTLAVDTTGSLSDSAFFSGVENDSDLFEPFEPVTFFQPRSGFFYIGAGVSLTSLDPTSLDPDLAGSLLFFNVKGHTLLNGWLFGGEWNWGHIYDIGSEFDDFTFDYGGLLAGYDTKIFYGALTLRGELLLGAGGVEMIKNRPDLGGSAGREILERVRRQNFYAIRPGISVGYSPIPYTDIRIGVNYLFPVGTGKLDDLRNLTYGLQFAFGVGE